ncbi:MAG: hypothetical protein U5K27_02350 [Desulfotignum sp.]|nr:hypothetical protein [Desulfotignum sp.]
MGFERFLMMITGITNIRDVYSLSQNTREY